MKLCVTRSHIHYNDINTVSFYVTDLFYFYIKSEYIDRSSFVHQNLDVCQGAVY